MSPLKITASAQLLPDAHQYLVIYFPKKLIEDHGLKPMDRIKVIFTEKRYIHCALKKDKKGQYCIYLGKFFREKAKIFEGQEVTLILEKDISDLGMEMPIELDEVLSIDEEAQKVWNQITPGRKRSAVYYISKAKQEETRIKRALLIAENLKMGFINLNEITRKH
jgi:bifunctional DNA-binding transcriptional regulator/antitoxin component of YhaV-PrlF toxin-antitoxin module